MATIITKWHIKVKKNFTLDQAISHLIARYYAWLQDNKRRVTLAEMIRSVDFLEQHYFRYLKVHEKEYDYKQVKDMFRKQVDFLIDLTGKQAKGDKIKQLQESLRQKTHG